MPTQEISIKFHRLIIHSFTKPFKMKTDFPSGTVTFLFTDIESSTKLWEIVPEKMKIALSRHHAILHIAIESNDGVAFQIIGDAFCAAFSTAPAAVSAALDAQHDLYVEQWDLPFPICARMGIHTGLAELTSSDSLTGGYASNRTLNRVARILSIGHGGQILLSSVTADLVRDHLPNDTSLHDLSEHRLKDLTRAEHVYQLIHPDLPTDFPPLKSLNIPQGNLMKKIRVLIADDHALFREGLRALLNAMPDIEVAGEAADGETAITQVATAQPDVILMDINMPGLNGIEATRDILSAHPSLGIIMVTMLEDDASVFAAMKAGARGYVLKGAHHEDILQAIRTVAGGQAVFGPAIAARMMAFFQNLNAASKPAASTDAFPELTDREREVLQLMSHGASNKDIAEKLVISGKTVSNHITNIFSKLQVADRAQAVLRARDAGLG